MSLAPCSSDLPLKTDDRPLVEEFFKYVGVFRRGWRYIAVSILISLTLAALYLFQIKTELEGSARLLMLHQGGRPLNTVVSGGKDPFDTLADFDDTPTHIMVIRSPAILERGACRGGREKPFARGSGAAAQGDPSRSHGQDPQDRVSGRDVPGSDQDRRCDRGELQEVSRG